MTIAPPVGLLSKWGSAYLQPRIDALEIDGDDAVEVVFVAVDDRARHTDTGIVEDDIQFAVPLHRAIDQAAHIRAGR